MTRLLEVWRVLSREQRRAALASLGLFVTMLLPWYSKTDTVIVKGAVKSAQTSLDAFQAFSFVEAAVLLVSAGVLALLFGRGEQRRFGLPGGDGIVVTVAGGWVAALIFYRLLDKPGLQGNERISATVGVEWGIFVALLMALGLAYAGWRIRHGERPAPPARRRGGDPLADGPRDGGDDRPRTRTRDGSEDDRPRLRERGGSEADRPRERDPGEGRREARTETPRAPATAAGRRMSEPQTDETSLIPVAAAQPEGARSAPVPAPSTAPQRGRPRFPPRPGEPEQLSFEDPADGD